MNATLQTCVPVWDELPIVETDRLIPDPKWSHALPAGGARRFRAVAVCKTQAEVVVATCNPQLASVHQFVTAQLQEPFRFVRVDEVGLKRLLRELYPPQTSYIQVQAGDSTCETVSICDELLRAAVMQHASDIHLLPEDDTLQARFRVDGVLEDYRSFPMSVHNRLVSRIKVMAGMNIAEKREPQDGRFSIRDAGQTGKIDVRAAVIPTRFGERVTLRLLLPMAELPSLERLGMNDRSLELFANAISSSHGLVLLTGPTGCGKSTTLYTAMTQLVRSGRGNVMTVEDPIEHEIPGASQVEIDSTDKVSFARALRSILRHDPDVIMLGEIRDAETAEIAIKASLTGHLVFSTLHTNTAAGVVTRLTDMGVEPFLIAATLRLAVAQRLVRKLCPECRKKTSVEPTQAQLLRDETLVGRDAYEADGCVYCMGKGYVGRVAVFEMLSTNQEIANLISAKATENELLVQMQQNNQPVLLNDGVCKVLSGVTTVEQVCQAVAGW